MRGRLQRVFASPKLIPALATLAIVSLFMSTWVVVQFTQAQADREQERIASDVASCERVNEFRRQVATIGRANDELVAGIVAVVLAELDGDESVERIRSQVAPLFAEHAATIETLEVTDCQAVTPGTTRPEGNP